MRGILLVSFLLGCSGFINYRYFVMRSSSIKSNKNAVKNNVEKYQPRSVNQATYVDALANQNIPIVIGVGSAGTGKTLFACQAAIRALQTGLVSKIVMTRPLISVDQEPMGFLPGSIEQKMSPWTRPMFDLLEEFYSAAQIKKMIEDSVIEIAPLAYMRGRTWKSTFLIADEIQNISPSQMFMLLTRLGEDSRIVITGDLKQSDFSGKNGLVDFIEKALRDKDCADIKIVELGEGDIQRSKIVQKIVSMYSPESEKPEKKTVIKKVEKIDESEFVHIDNDCALIPRHLNRWNPKLGK